MKKGTIEISQNVMIGIILSLLVLIISIALLNLMKDKNEKTIDYMKSNMPSWEFGCTNAGLINNIEELTLKMYELDLNCKNNNVCECKYYTYSNSELLNITKQILIDNNLTDYYGGGGDEWNARIMCCENTHSPIAAELDIFNPPKCTVNNITKCSKWTDLDRVPFFIVKSGSTVSIKAIKKFSVADLRINIKER